MMRLAPAVGLCLLLVGLPWSRAEAAETWWEVTSPHFTALSNASDGRTQALMWQLEQIRSATRALWPWIQTELGRPLLVLIVKDEHSMRALAPRYWEQRGGVRPVALWATGPERYYLVLRADQREDDNVLVNPYTSAYFIYLHLLVQSSFSGELPLWFSRGLAGLLSNTIVRSNDVLVGLPMPDYLHTLREGRRLRLSELVDRTRTSPETSRDEALYRFDAQAWAFVHFLYSGAQGAHKARLERFAGMLKGGHDPAAAFREALGRPEDYEHGFATYLTSTVYGYTRNAIDARVQRERFVRRALGAADAAAARAGLHVAMGREKEARALIEEARKADPDHAPTHLAEALLFDRSNQRELAKAAYARAVALDTTSAYAYYRNAILSWSGPVDRETLQEIEKHLTRAVQLNARFAAAYAALGEVRAALKEPPDQALSLVRRAISLEPTDPWHRLSAARVHWRAGHLEDAVAEARQALDLAETNDARQLAQELVRQLEKARAVQ